VCAYFVKDISRQMRTNRLQRSMVDKKQLDRIEKKLDKLEKKLDNHIEEIWTVYKPIKELLKKLERFKLW
jgi:hypothetical protein